jgi:hypothetical protein
MTSVDRDRFVHEHVLKESGVPRAYTTQFGATEVLMQKLKPLYAFDYYLGYLPEGGTQWRCQVSARMEQGRSSTTWGASTCPEAICLAVLDAHNLITLSDLAETGCR